MEEINLLQNRVKDRSSAWQREGILTLQILSGILVIVLAISAILFFLNRSLTAKVAVLSADNQKVSQALSDRQKNLGDATTFQAQLANLKVLLKNHTYFSPLLDELAKFTYQKAQYVTLDATSAGKIHLEGNIGSYND